MKTSPTLLLSLFLGIPALSALAQTSDTTLEPVVTANLPVFTSLTSYDYSDIDTTSNAGDPSVQHDQTLYYPFDCDTYQWWDNLVGEEIQARLPVVMFATRGAYSTNPSNPLYASGDMNPRELSQMVAAMQRAGVTNQMQIACFVDTPFILDLSNYLLGVPSTTSVDLSNQSNWANAWWLGGIKPWFDTVPKQYWYTVNGQPVIEFWGGMHATNFASLGGLLNYLTAQFQATYGVSPVFIIDQQWTENDTNTAVLNVSNVVGVNSWYAPPTKSYTYTQLDNFVSGCAVAGCNIYVPGSTNHNNPNSVIPRNGISGTGANGDTLIEGLQAAYTNKADLTVLEGWNDVREFCGLYRSTSPRWSFPNQYINIIGRYTDLRTTTRRLEAEACDEYGGSPGNPNHAYRRTGTLGIRGFGGVGTAISNGTSNVGQAAAQAFDGNTTSKWLTSTAPVWLEYDCGYGSEHGTGNTAAVTAYTLTSADAQGRDPSAWQFQASTDGSTWITLDTQTGQTFTARQQARRFNISNTTSYRYYRLNVTAVYGGSSQQTALAEMTFTTSSVKQSSGWAVCDTVANEWVQFDQVNFSAGNYKFPVRYSSTASHKLQLYIDGTALPAVTVPSTGNMSTFQIAYLGTKALTQGTHNLKVVFVDGGVDLDWVFVKKYDPMMSFKSSSTNCYLTANLGGNDTIVSNRTAAGVWENFSIDDLSGAGTVSSGNVVNLQAYDGLYITADGNGGSTLEVNRIVPGIWENWTIEKIGGSGALANGDKVALKSDDGTHYLTVVNGTTVNDTGTSIGSAQTFTVNITPQ